LSPQTGIDNNYIYLPKIQVLPREALATDHTIQELQCLLTSEKQYKQTNMLVNWLLDVFTYEYVYNINNKKEKGFILESMDLVHANWEHCIVNNKQTNVK